MDKNDFAVDWSLLPHSPQAFFGVEDGFDRRDLKRKYNRLIRRFKPEKSPAEFQKIRAAYEILDNHLRYGTQLDRVSENAIPYQWQTDELAVDAARAASTRAEKGALSQGHSSPIAAPPLQEQIRREPLAQVYQKLAQKPEKQPYEYYALAVMSDIVHRKDNLQFVRWILQGLVKYPQDYGLTCLLYEYLRGPVPEQALAGLLVAVSQAVPNDTFYALTEPLWRRLLRGRTFAKFCETLKKCTDNLQDIGIDGRLVFLIEMLRAAIWVADHDWIEEVTTLIDENFERIPVHLQFDVDILGMLNKYVAQRPAFLASHPLRERMDSALRDYFSEDQALGDRSVLNCQILIAEDPASILQAFPFETENEYSDIYLLWSYVTADVAERHSEEPAQPVNLSVWGTRGRALFQRIERNIKASSIGWGRIVADWGYQLLLGALYFTHIVCVTIFLVTATLNDWDNLGIILFILFGLGGGGWFLARWIHHRFLRPRWQNYLYQKLTRYYKEISRIELAEFLQRSQFNYQELKELMISSDVSGLDLAQSTYEHYQMDYALAIYAAALTSLV